MSAFFSLMSSITCLVFTRRNWEVFRTATTYQRIYPDTHAGMQRRIPQLCANNIHISIHVWNSDLKNNRDVNIEYFYMLFIRLCFSQDTHIKVLTIYCETVHFSLTVWLCLRDAAHELTTLPGKALMNMNTYYKKHSQQNSRMTKCCRRRLGMWRE